MKKVIVEFLLPVVLLMLVTACIWLSGADMKVAGFIYKTHHGWVSVQQLPWSVLYTYAPLPGLVLAGGAFFVFIAGFFVKILRSYRKHAAFLVLMLLLGPGLLVNVILKDNMGRARPTDIIEFGGNYQYSQPWQYNISLNQKSFPSGHASMAFYMMAPWFIYRRRQKKLGLCFLVSGLSFGLLVGGARMLQGGHFISDVLWAGGLVYFSGVVLAWFLDLSRESCRWSRLSACS
jgi:membrane-associated PAP2 superfamily phosphatase